MPAAKKKTVKDTKVKTKKTTGKKKSVKKTPVKKKVTTRKVKEKKFIASAIETPVNPETPVISELPLIEESEAVVESPVTLEIPSIVDETSTDVPDFGPECDIAPKTDLSDIASRITGVSEVNSDEKLPNLNILMDGGFNISRQVLARIASLAANEITGLAPAKQNPLNKFMDQIRGKVDGIRVDVGTTEAAVDMDIRVEYGTQIPEISNQIREVVARRIHEMTGLKVVEVNIRVQDITPPVPSGS